MGKCSPVAVAITETMKEICRAMVFLPKYPLMSELILTTSLKLFSTAVGTRHGDKQCKSYIFS